MIGIIVGGVVLAAAVVLAVVRSKKQARVALRKESSGGIEEALGAALSDELAARGDVGAELLAQLKNFEARQKSEKIRLDVMMSNQKAAIALASTARITSRQGSLHSMRESRKPANPAALPQLRRLSFVAPGSAQSQPGAYVARDSISAPPAAAAPVVEPDL
jgi:hypothetical protein